MNTQHPQVAELKVNTDEAIIRQLTQQWLEAWSPKAEPFDIEKLRPLFSQGEILVFDDMSEQVAVMHSWDEYKKQWEPFMEQFAYWEIQFEDELKVTVEGNFAFTTFTWVGGGRFKDGREIPAKQHGTHVWNKQNNQWVIVHEHLTVG